MLHVVAADGEQLPSSGWLLVVSSSVSRRCLSTVVARWSRHYQVNSPHMDDVLLNIVHRTSSICGRSRYSSMRSTHNVVGPVIHIALRPSVVARC